MKLVVFGVRGSTPVGGAAVSRYGGDTICLGVELGEGRHVVIDAGTGVRNLGHLVAESAVDAHDFWFFLTHYHLDHLQGLPFFKPLYNDRNRFTFHGYHWEEMGVEEMIAGTFRPPWFPIRFEETPSFKRFVELRGDPVEIDGLVVRPERLRHPQGVTAYRLDHEGRSIVIATDHEAGHTEYDTALIEMARGADVLIHDAQYTKDEYDQMYEGWGHSTWDDAITTAEVAGVDRLVVISHDPDRTDDELDALVKEARGRFPNLDAAYQGMVIEI